jgi:hypothetical protein
MSSCKIVQDLLPLYVEDICSPSSREYVEAHLAECDKCRAVHKAMCRRIQIVATQQNAKKSFASFKRKMLLRRILLITLCVALSFALLFAVLHQPIDRFLYDYHPVNIEFVESTVWRLSDGSIYIDLAHTEEYTSLSGYTCGPHPENENVLVIEPLYQVFHHLNNPSGDREIPHRLIITTAESYPKYTSDSRTLNMLSHPYTCVILSSTDGERIIWQEGDELPAADQEGELKLQFHIDHNHLIPISDES